MTFSSHFVPIELLLYELTTTHGHLQLKHQKLGVGSFREESASMA